MKTAAAAFFFNLGWAELILSAVSLLPSIDLSYRRRHKLYRPQLHLFGVFLFFCRCVKQPESISLSVMKCFIHWQISSSGAPSAELKGLTRAGWVCVDGCRVSVSSLSFMELWEGQLGHFRKDLCEPDTQLTWQQEVMKPEPEASLCC